MCELEVQDLVRSAQCGDRDAFGQLVVLFEKDVFAVALRRLRNRAEAAEVAQDVFIQALRKLPQLREIERFPGWLRQITVRMSINRAVRRGPEGAPGPEAMSALESQPDNPLETLLQSEAAGQVRGCLDRLGDLDRRTLIAFYFEGQSLKEMSDAFESPIGTIKRRLHTARNRLRDELTELQTAG